MYAYVHVNWENIRLHILTFWSIKAWCQKGQCRLNINFLRRVVLKEVIEKLSYFSNEVVSQWGISWCYFCWKVKGIYEFKEPPQKSTTRDTDYLDTVSSRKGTVRSCRCSIRKKRYATTEMEHRKWMPWILKKLHLETVVAGMYMQMLQFLNIG